MAHGLHSETKRQIEALELDARPLIVCDVDEVVLQFVAAFEAHIARNGHYLDARSFALTGNVRETGGGTPATPETVRALLHDFFTTQMHTPEPVAGAADALAALSGAAQIVMLTNIPHEAHATRVACLDGHGLCYPVIANSGGKGPAMARLAARAGAPAFFLDDSPGNIRSVAAHVPSARLIHFVADPRFAALCEPVPEAHLKTGDWREAHDFIAMHLAGAGAEA